MVLSLMVVKSEWTTPSLRELIPQPLGCIWGVLPALGMVGVRGEEGEEIGMVTEEEMIEDTEAAEEEEMTTAEGGLHLHTGGGAGGAGPGHSHQGERDTDGLNIKDDP